MSDPASAGASEPTASEPTASEPYAQHRNRRRGVGPFSFRQVGLAFGSVVVAGLVLTAITTPLGPSDPGSLPDPRATAYLIASPTTGLAPGDRAPELEVPLADGETFQLRDLDGNPIRLADLRGQAVWVNFWASWCPPCQAETPTMRDLANRYRERGLVLVAIDVQETIEDARAYAERYELEYVIGADVSGHVFRAWRVFALPTQFFLDTDGVIRSIVQGPLDEEGAIARFEPLLPQ